MTGGDHLDKKLLELMYARYYRELYIYIYSMCRSGVITEDILQETFLKAFISLKDSHTNMRAWLYITSRNLCLILPAPDLTQKIPLSNQCFEMKSSEYFTERCFGFHLRNAILCSCSISRDCGRMKYPRSCI